MVRQRPISPKLNKQKDHVPNTIKLSEHNKRIYPENRCIQHRNRNRSSTNTKKNKIIGLCGCKLLPVKTRYTTAKKEFLEIIKTLKYFRTIMFNVHIKIKTDHANLLYNIPVENN
ncbi:hypothetical protein PAEPH01_2717 [Pancytospora epiphaga]|nr:hypothetical protein PAEPH01_2717 [Pancytospora epiphaga]